MSDSINAMAERGDLAGVQQHLTQGTPVDFIDNGRFNETALQIASRRGHLEIVILLLQAGAQVNHEDNDGFSPVTSAARAKHWSILKCLAEHGGRFEIMDGYGKSGADYLALCRRPKIRKQIEDILTSRNK